MKKSSDNKQKFTVNPIKLWRDAKDAVLMFFHVCCGKYPLPKKSLIWVIIFFLYLSIPFDLIPDPLIALFGLGVADDLLVLVYILNKMSPDLEKFRFFKNTKLKNANNIIEISVNNDDKIN